MADNPAYTTNYGLIKPAQTDTYNIDVPNENMDTIDGLLKKALIRLVQRNTIYSVGDIATSPNLKSWAYLECTSVTTTGTSGTTAASEPTWPTTAGSTVTDGTVVWTLRNKQQKSAYVSATDTASADGTKVPTLGFLLGLLADLSSNETVTWDGNNFSCPALGINGLIAQNGYISFGKLFGGLILQWGIGTINITDASNGGTNTISLPITFPNANFNVLATYKNNGLSLGTLSAYAYALSTSQISLALDASYGTNGPSGTQSVYWIAIGK